MTSVTSLLRREHGPPLPSVGGVVDALTYDGFGGLESSTTTCDVDVPVYAYDLVRDELGRIISETETLGADPAVVWEYEYDARGRLLGVDKDGFDYEDYSYDANDNRLTVTSPGNGTKTATTNWGTVGDR